MNLRALHVSLLMEADRHGSVNPVTKADEVACAELRECGCLTPAGVITEKGRRVARQGEH